jgi:hypothetical protein
MTAGPAFQSARKMPVEAERRSVHEGDPESSLPRLLSQVEQGETITITKRGRPSAPAVTPRIWYGVLGTPIRGGGQHQSPPFRRVGDFPAGHCQDRATRAVEIRNVDPSVFFGFGASDCNGDAFAVGRPAR